MHYACIIGVNHEWPEQRKSRGDIGLARCLSRHCNLNRQHLVEVYDERATRSNVLHSLEQLLNVRNKNASEDDVLLLYYGGHGKRAEACTFTKSIVNGNMLHEPWLRYDEVVDLLERKFRGGTAWVIVDCCHSGSFGEAVMKRYHQSNKLNVNYGCVMSVPPWDIAGMEWSVTECFIRAFKGELSCNGRSLMPHYLSTKKGKHSIEILDADGIEFAKNSASDISKSQPGLHPSWEQVIEFLADEMARIKGDQLTTLFCGKRMSDGEYLKRPCLFGEQFTSANTTQSSQLEMSISRDKTWMNAFVQRVYSMNDEVYVKWSGPTNSAKDSSNSSGYTIGWLPGRITSIENDTACINVRDVITQTNWTAEATIDNIMGGLPFSFHLDPQQCATAVTHLAKQLCYFDTSLHPYTCLQILWNDGKFYPGMVMCPNEVVWELVNAHEVDDDYHVKGPYVPVKWVEERTISLVPRGKCVLASQELNKKELVRAQRAAEKAAREASNSIQTPMDAMLASLTSSGKNLHPTNVPILSAVDVREQDNHEWEAYDAESKDFLPVQLMNHITKVPLKVLAYHMCYRQSGNFSVIFWEEDSVLSLAPSNFLRLKSSAEDNSSGDENSDDENSESTTMHTTEIGHFGLDHLDWLSVAFVTFGIGFLLGKRAKAS